MKIITITRSGSVQTSKDLSAREIYAIQFMVANGHWAQGSHSFGRYTADKIEECYNVSFPADPIPAAT